jgi:serine/threonine protein kinase
MSGRKISWPKLSDASEAKFDRSMDPNSPSSNLPSSGPLGSALPGLLETMLGNGNLDPPAKPGQLATLDSFEILRLTGAGGMGVVFQARDSKTGSEIAIKMLRPELAAMDDGVKRFLKEARRVQQLQHPNVITISKVMDRADGPYFVMPYFKGGSLARLIRAEGSLPRDKALKLASEVAAGLRQAHSQGIVHRDIKPANVLIDDDGPACVSDFGLAKSLIDPSSAGLEPIGPVGTPSYMSPGVAAGGFEDIRGDIYGFGALLYEILTGEPPFAEAGDSENVRKLLLAGPPKPISKHEPSAPLDLAIIAEGAMARELRDRYATMEDVVTDLDRVSRGQAPRGPSGQLNWLKIPRRMSRPLAAVMVLAGLVFAVWILWPRHKLSVVRTFSSPAVENWAPAKLGAWDDADKPAIFIPVRNELRIFSMRGEPLGDYSIPDSIVQGLNVDLLADVWAPNGTTTDGRAEVFLSWTQQETNLHLAILKQNRAPVKQFEARGAVCSHSGKKHSVTDMHAAAIADLDADGRRELLALVNTGFDGDPRGLYCFDFESQTLRWRRLIGPAPTQVALFRLDSKRKLGVLMGTAAVSNGIVSVDGSDDSHSYAYAFSDTGEVLWRRVLGDEFTHTHPLVADLEGDGQEELLVWMEGSSQFRTNEVGCIIKLDRATGAELGRYESGARLLSCLTEDLDGDGKPEIIASDNQGFVHIVDAGLTCVRKENIVPRRNDFDGNLRQHNFVYLELAAITNLDGKSGKEIVLISHQTQLVNGLNPGTPEGEGNAQYAHDVSVHVLNSGLAPSASHKIASRWENSLGASVSIVNADHGRHPELLVFAKDKVQVLKFR